MPFIQVQEKEILAFHSSRFLSQLLKSACGGAMAEQARCSHGCALLAQFWGAATLPVVFVCRFDVV